MNEAAKKELEYQKNLERIRQLRLMDDDFFQVCMQDNIKAVQLLLRIIIDDPGLVVTKAVTQKEMKNLLGHSLCLDVYAVDAKGQRINVEIQRKDPGAVPERAVCHSAMLDANSLAKGEQDFRKKAETYTIMITENDVLGGKLPIYHVERVVLELDKAPFGGKSHIIYVNGAYDGSGKSNLEWLIHDFRCKEPGDMHFQELAERVRYFKEESEGIKVMCKIWEDVKDEGRAEGRIEGRVEGRVEGRAEGKAEMVVEMLKEKQPLDFIARISNFSQEKIAEIGKLHVLL